MSWRWSLPRGSTDLMRQPRLGLDSGDGAFMGVKSKALLAKASWPIPVAGPSVSSRSIKRLRELGL